MLINSPAIGNLIREKKVSQIYSQLQTGTNEGMNTLEQCLIRLMNEGLISRSTALAAAGNPKAIAMAGIPAAEG